MTALLIILCFVLGAVIGSFLNVLIIRMPQEQGVGGRSHCMNCGKTLRAWELLPIFSYLMLRGKCSQCQAPISKRYIIIEILCGILFALAAAFSAVWSDASAFTILELLRNFFIISIMIAVFAIDLEHYLILDKVIFPGAVILFLFNLILDLLAHPSFWQSYTVAGLLAGLGVFGFFGSIYWFSKGRWMGFGDVKLGWLLGLAMPFPLIIVSIFGSFLMGTVIGVILIVLGDKSLQSKVPFGTFLAAGTILSVFLGSAILNWYLRLIGIY